jgi:hypothetical protein
MVVTFKGAVFALEGSTDLPAIRAALAEPIRGLGLSFGTSVAGVAASAMLGLMSANSRRERLDVSRLLDLCAAGELRAFTLAHQRDETLRAVQAQAAACRASVCSIRSSASMPIPRQPIRAWRKMSERRCAKRWQAPRRQRATAFAPSSKPR